MEIFGSLRFGKVIWPNPKSMVGKVIHGLSAIMRVPPVKAANLVID